METKGSKIELPPWAQGIIAVTLLAGAIGLSYVGVNYFKKRKEEKESKEVTDDITEELKKSEKEGLKLSKPKSSYSSTVSLIVKLLSGAETGGSEMQVIEEIMKVVKNKLDWQYLVKTFGVKNVPDIGWGETNYNLITLLKDQLDSMPGTGGWKTYVAVVPGLQPFAFTNGVYNINVDGYKATGYASKTRDILSDYLKSIGVDF